MILENLKLQEIKETHAGTVTPTAIAAELGPLRQHTRYHISETHNCTEAPADP